MNRIVFIFCLFCLWACDKNSKQEDMLFLNCDQERLVFNKEAQAKHLECQTNLGTLNFSFDQEGEKWCRGIFEAGKLVFEVQENKLPQPRETTVTVGNGDIFIKIVVFQSGTDPVLFITPDTLRILSYENIVQTEISTNIEYEVTVTQGKDWITILSAEEGKEHIRKFRIAENNAPVTRAGTVTFQQEGGNLKSELTIIQQNYKYTAELKVPFGRMGFIEPLEKDIYAKKKAQGIQNWMNDETVIKFFVNVAGEPQSDDSLFMEVQGYAYENADLELKINGVDAGSLHLKTGSFRQALPVFVPASSDYQCISFKGINGGQTGAIHYPNLDTMVIRYRPGLELDYDNSTYGASAAHLGYDQDNNNNIEWSLGEVMVKTEGCRPDVYYMVSHFNGGYCGIQVHSDLDLNEPRGKTFLFSVWSDYTTDHPSEIPDDYQPWTDEIGAEMKDGSFGGEGSGVHANWDYAWYPDVIYKFLIHQEDVGTVRRNGKDYPNCKAYTCWIYAPEKGGWIFFVRYIRPNDKRTTLDKPGSFVENPGGSNSSSKYRAYYRHWIRYRGANEWVALKYASLGANEDHPRYDFGIGKEVIHDKNGYGGEFCYLFSGGFTVNTGKAGAKEELSFTEMPDVDLKHLPALELFDNMKFGDTKEKLEEIDRTNWIATASSEDSYDKAGFAIDGNLSTSWHTCYTGTIPDYPHWIQIDMQKSETFNELYIQPKGWDVPKEFRVEISENENNWTDLGIRTLQNNGDIQNFVLDETKTARYLKITFLNGYTTQAYTSIREIGMFKYK